MRKLDEIAEDLSQIIRTKFQAVRLSGMQTGEQFLKELAPLNPATLPAVIIAFRAAVGYARTGHGRPFPGKQQ